MLCTAVTRRECTALFKVQGALLNTLHAMDKVTFSVSEAGGTKTITKLKKQ